MEIITHLYKRTITSNGKSIKAWYFWFYDENGKQVRRSCGSKKKPCTIKRDAEQFLANLDKSSLISNPKKKETISAIMSNLYDKESSFIKRREAKGFVLMECTRKTKDYSLKIFLEKFGNLKPEELNIDMIEDWLLTYDRTNSWRNSMLTMVRDIYTILYNENYISKIPLIKNFKKKAFSSKDILTESDIHKLFPDDIQEIARIWCRKNEGIYYGYMFYAAAFLTLTSGMRSGELRALKKSQFIKNDTIFLNAMINAENERVEALKKHTEENNKWRISILPKKTVTILENLSFLEKQIEKKTDYLFEYNGDFLSKRILLDRFKSSLERAGINDGRNITIHSLRFTYNTMMRHEIDDNDLRMMMGHSVASMTDYYDKSSVLDNLPELEKNRQKIDEIFS